ncbi:MAG TPA: DUF1573 domain-containing protein [Gemmataceae bacterium]|nr:DUF1573 domain-containing protein [Gemmataceae bacterium]
MLPVVCFAAYHLGTLAATAFASRARQPEAPTVNGLSIDPSSLDLGEVWETPRHTTTLKIKNVSGDVRTVTDFEASCDCLGVEPRALTLQPGQAAELTVSLDLTHRQPYQLGLARWPTSVQIRPRFQGDFAPTPGWLVKASVRSRVSLEAAQLAFGDRCVHDGPPASRKVRARAHVPLRRLEASALPDLAEVRVEEDAAPGGYRIVVSPHPALPVGPFRFRVQVRAVTADGAAHECGALDVSGEMQPSSRIFPRLVLLGEHPVADRAEADVSVRLPASGWAIDRIETDGPDTTVSRLGVGPDGEQRLRVAQRIARAGDQVATVRVIIRKPDRQTEAVTVQVRYYGQTGPR